MAEQLSGCEAAKVIDEPVKTIVGCVAALVPEGSARTLLYVVVGLCVAVAPLHLYPDSLKMRKNTCAEAIFGFVIGA